MESGQTIAGRFIVERLVATGGMGQVYRASDRVTGQPIALKTMVADDSTALLRFLQESAVLAEIRHPGIVRHVAHGRLDDGSAYLAMEWLEGEDLARFLRKHARPADPEHDPCDDVVEPATMTLETVPSGETAGDRFQRYRVVTAPQPIADTIALGRRVAAALAELHDRGLIHRDIKPGNLFLAGGRIAQVKLLDLGVAHRLGTSDRYLPRGAILGTPHYMAPEQARASDAVTPATDVWSVGCVLYQCIAGRLPFDAASVTALLTCILLQEPAPLSVRRADVPDELAALIMQALSKDPTHRPDARALLAALDALAPDAPDERARGVEEAGVDRGRAVLTESESRVACMVIAEPATEATEATEATTHAALDAAALAEVARATGGKLEQLATGALLITVPDAQTPADQAVLAAKTALALRAASSVLAFALVSGRTRGRQPVGAVAGVAARILSRCAPGEIRTDRMTATLLDARFHLRAYAGNALLVGERAAESTRTLLGKPTPWVGRDDELAALMATFEQCARDRVARAVVVTARAGVGKSRLCHEFLRTLRAHAGEVAIIHGRGEAVSEGSAFSVIAPALRRLAGVTDADPLAVRRAKLRRRLAETVAARERDRVVALLGEMCRVPFADGDDTLRAARKDPVFMGQLMQQAWQTWLAGECARGPLVLVLDDLHWGDWPSVQYVDSALDQLHDRPLMVLALGRPEVHTMFPELWAKRSVAVLELGELSRAASARLAREVLGAAAAADVVDHIAALAGGNAFYLEELIRTVAARRTGDRAGALPDSVVGTVQSRLDELGGEGKRILRAASVFGEVFWSGGVTALLGEAGVFELDEWLRDLVAGELIQRRPEPRLAGEREFEFRHALLRDCVYATLTDEDRTLGHALAGEWLERAGELDQVSLAEHFLRGDAPERAIPCLHRAAQQALEGNDFRGAWRCAERAVAAGASGERLGELRGLQAVASYWLSDYERCRRAGVDAADAVAAGSASWWNALGNAIVSCFRLRDDDGGSALVARAVAATCQPGAESEQIGCLSRAAAQLAIVRRYELADALIARVMALVDQTERVDPRTEGQFYDARYLRAHAYDWEEASGYVTRAVELFEAAGDRRNTLMTRTSLGLCWMQLGWRERALELGERNLAACRASGAKQAISLASILLGWATSDDAERAGEARQLLEAGVADYRETGNWMLEGWALGHLASLEFALGDHEEAERAAGRAVSLLGDDTIFSPRVLALHARTLLALGRLDEASERGRRAVAAVHRTAGPGGSKGFIHLVDAEVAHARGARDDAHQTLAKALCYIAADAARIREPGGVAAFLATPDHRAALALARAWGIA